MRIGCETLIDCQSRFFRVAKKGLVTENLGHVCYSPFAGIRCERVFISLTSARQSNKRCRPGVGATKTFGENKLERFALKFFSTVVKRFWVCLEAHLPNLLCGHQLIVDPALLKDIRLGWKGLLVSNELAYCSKS